MRNVIGDLRERLHEQLSEAVDHLLHVYGHAHTQLCLLQQIERVARQTADELTEFSAVEGLGGDDFDRTESVADTGVAGRDPVWLLLDPDNLRDEGRDQ